MRKIYLIGVNPSLRIHLPEKCTVMTLTLQAITATNFCPQINCNVVVNTFSITMRNCTRYCRYKAPDVAVFEQGENYFRVSAIWPVVPSKWKLQEIQLTGVYLDSEFKREHTNLTLIKSTAKARFVTANNRFRVVKYRGDLAALFAAT